MMVKLTGEQAIRIQKCYHNMADELDEIYAILGQNRTFDRKSVTGQSLADLFREATDLLVRNFKVSGRNSRLSKIN